MPSPKEVADKWFSLYIRLRDAIEFQKEVPDADIAYGRCCTCGIIKQWKYMDCGHFISKSRGGASGVRWDERNAHLQCKPCNGFNQGRYHEYELFMIDKYGQDTIDLLKWLHTHQSYKYKIVGIGLMYQQMFEELKNETHI
ncbi:hypothetical protein LCGC14_2000510 [marine sediment metagenome]|uniref:Uncharacterized protein n=1 Tax=marine sediment metagenome TaxID=412755 RepID=A0A0F9FR86_9ZZZZ